MTRKSILRWTEYSLWTVGVVSLGLCAAYLLQARAVKASRNRELDRPIQESSAPKTQNLVGRLEIPRLGVSAIVLEGDDERTLRLGVGHVPGTPLPGAPGNVVLAGHQDTFFRPLREIRKDDRIILTTPYQRHEYAVESTAIVDAENAQALETSTQPALTLVTCYPFDYAGSAPQRFVVRARCLFISHSQ